MPEPVALGRLDRDHRPGQRAVADLVVAAVAGLRGEQLGVGQLGDLAALAVRQDHRGRDQRAGARSAARPRRHRRSGPGRPGAGRARTRTARRHAVSCCRGARRSSINYLGGGVREIEGLAGGGPAAAGTILKVSGTPSLPNRPAGQTTRIARPVTLSSGTKAASPGLPPSASTSLQVHAGVAGLGAVVAHHEDPAGRHGDLELHLRGGVTGVQVAALSSSGWPFTSSRPLESQQATLSPGIPIRRLIR